MRETLAQVEGYSGSGHSFCAGIVLWDDRVVETAPIVRSALKGRNRDQVREIARRRQWKIRVVHELERPHQRS